MLRVFLTVVLVSMFGLGVQAQEKTTPNGSAPAIAEALVDYFDGLRAWELGEKPVAVGMWLKAAGWGDTRAMQRLGSLYEIGDNVPLDADMAYFWFALAVQRGLGSAEADSKRLRQKVHSDRISSLDDALSKWQPANFDPQSIDQSAADSQPTPKPTENDLILALANSDIQSFESALANGVSPKTLTSDRVPVIVLAAAKPEKAFVQALLKAGAEPNAELANGMTSLHLAAGTGNQAIVELLLEKGASPVVQDRNGTWPSDLAKKKGHLAVAELLSKRLKSDVVALQEFLFSRGYMSETGFFNVVERDKGLRMYQQGQFLAVNGVVDQETYKKLSADTNANVPIAFRYVIRFKKSGLNWYKSKTGTYWSVSDARAAALDWCNRESGKECKFNFTPQGGCIAVAKPPSGSFRIAKPQLTQAEASADALAQCSADTDGCKVETTLCATNG